jgi:hypothetical protein
VIARYPLPMIRSEPGGAIHPKCGSVAFFVALNTKVYGVNLRSAAARVRRGGPLRDRAGSVLSQAVRLQVRFTSTICAPLYGTAVDCLTRLGLATANVIR